MSELWTSPKAGPFPSGHLFGFAENDIMQTRCGRLRQATIDQENATTSEPPPTSEGRTCETCLRLANRDRVEDPIAGNDPEQPEDDASTQDEGPEA